MKKTINRYDFHRAFEQMRPNSFSYEGLDALYDWFEEFEDSTSEEIELDVIAICCDWSELTLDEIRASYEPDTMSDDDLIEWLQDRTQVIDLRDKQESTVIIMDF